MSDSRQDISVIKAQLISYIRDIKVKEKDLLQEIGNDLTGDSRNIGVEESTSDGTTDAGVQSCSILFRGENGTLDGVTVPDNFTASFSPNKGADTINGINYTVPTTGESKVIISYVR